MTDAFFGAAAIIKKAESMLLPSAILHVFATKSEFNHPEGVHLPLVYFCN